jgi:histidinol-phosphatase
MSVGLRAGSGWASSVISSAPVMPSRREELLAFALELARAAERVILPLYRRCVVTLKADGSEVTDADRGAEAVMREMISSRFPDHAILGEEQGGGAGPAAGRWILDPIDGTTSFAVGVPLFGTLIAFLEEGEPVVGVMHYPVLGETVYAARGLGCHFQGRGVAPLPVHVASAVPLREALVSATGVHGSDINPGEVAYRLTPVIRGARKFRFFADCVQHGLVCRGNIHVAIDTVMKPWDIAALIPCIEEAGGVASNLDGQQDNVIFGGSLISSCDRALHDEVVGLLAP